MLVLVVVVLVKVPRKYNCVTRMGKLYDGVERDEEIL